MDCPAIEAIEAREGDGRRTLSTKSAQNPNWNLAVRLGRSTIFPSRKLELSLRAAGNVMSGRSASDEWRRLR